MRGVSVYGLGYCDGSKPYAATHPFARVFAVVAEESERQYESLKSLEGRRCLRYSVRSCSHLLDKMEKEERSTEEKAKEESGES